MLIGWLTGNMRHFFYILMLFLYIWVRSLKFIYSEKATKFCEISTNDLYYVLPVKYLLEILQNFVALSEYMNFTKNTKNNSECWKIIFLIFASFYH